jgi:hypothetical protein
VTFFFFLGRLVVFLIAVKVVMKFGVVLLSICVTEY